MRILLAVLLLFATTAAFAQDTVRRVQGASIVVTESIVASPLDSLPISYSNRIVAPTQAASSSSLDQVARAIPGLQIDNRNNYALGDRITIRGMGARSFFGTRGIRVLKDNLPLTFADGQTNLEIVDPSQLTEVGVIRGPSAWIFGNASGGTLLLSSAMPPALGNFMQLNGTAGAWGYQRFGGSIGSRSENLAYGAYATFDTLTGYRNWSGMKSTHFGSQALYSFENDALSFVFDHITFSAQSPGSLPQDSLASSRRSAFAQNLDRKTGKNGNQSQFAFTYTNRFETDQWVTTAYTILRDAVNPTPQQIIDLQRNLIGVRSAYLSGAPSDDLLWSASLDLQYQMDTRIEHTNVRGENGVLVTDQDENILNAGLALNTSYVLVDDLRATAGLRFDLLTFSARDHLIDSTNPDESGEVNLSAISPAIGLVYSGFGDHHLFANVSTNFETPTSTELANKPDGSGGYNNDLDPQRTFSFEGGVRGRIDDDLSYSVAAFSAAITNALIPFEVEGQDGRTFYRNAGKIQNNGVELELIATPFEGFRAIGAYTFINSRFTDYVVGSTSFNGNEQPGIYPQMAAIDLTYRFSFGLYVNSTAKWAATVAVNDANTFYSSEYTAVDLKAGFTIGLGGIGPDPLLIEPYVHIHNLFDRLYNGSFAINAFGGRYYEPAPERSIYAGLQFAL